MIITLGESIQEIILGRIRRAKSFGILADEAADVAVLQQFIIFLKYVNPDTGVAKTEFLPAFRLRVRPGKEHHQSLQ